MRTLLKNIAHLYTPDPRGKFGDILDFEHVHLLIEDGRIGQMVTAGQSMPAADRVLDLSGKCLLPGFIDPHTHPVFWKTREDEFIMRIQGKSYEEIAAAGGGIRNSVRKFRQASKEEIKSVTRERIKKFLEFGVTTIEAKSGYGLSTADEIKSLEIIRELDAEQPLDLIPTFLGAHEIPDEAQSDPQLYVDLVCEKMIPLVAERKLAKYCDVFCEKGVFTVEQSRKILLTALDYGLKARIHADELAAFGGAELAAEIGAVTADHLVMASDQGIEAMAKKGVIPVLLPGTTFFLGKEQYARARDMIAAGCLVAISTDFNPGSSTTQNLQLIWTIAALKLKMLPGELLWASTYVPALSLNLEKQLGTIEPGKQADLVALNIPNLNYLPYHYGINHTYLTIKKGNIVYQAR